MNNIVLITTGNNQVREWFLNYISCVTVIDCDLIHNKQQLLEAIQAIHSFDILITYRCPYILPRWAYTHAMHAFNIHPSLLPKYAGLNPWEEIFAAHEKQGGVTIHRLTEHVDAGEIIVQEAFEITAEDTIESARKKADMLAAKLVKYLIPLS